jgi:serine/alanine adding enzyme
MRVHLYEPAYRTAWENYVMKSGSATCYHLIGWKDVIEKSFGHRTWYLLSHDNNGSINGILPMVHLKSLLFGSFGISLPFFNYGGVCADDDDASRRLISEAKMIAGVAGMEHIELRHANNILPEMPVKASKVAMHLALPDKYEDLAASFGSKLRSQIKRARKEGMYARLVGIEELDNFYDVFSRNMRDLGTPVYSRKFFRNILEMFPEKSRICTVYTRDGVPAASGFIIGFKDSMEIPWASSVRRFNRFAPNMLLYSTVLEHACSEGYKTFDFGRSTPGEGTYKFKEQWGGEAPAAVLALLDEEW